MALKIPPPPPIASQDPQLNRWLLELTSILNASGGIDPNTIVGYPELQTQVADNTHDIATLGGTVGGNTGNITALQNAVAAIGISITAINGQITSLGARAQVLNGVGVPNAGLGNVNDWYANIGGAAGARIYVKTAATTWTAFPF